MAEPSPLYRKPASATSAAPNAASAQHRSGDQPRSAASRATTTGVYGLHVDPFVGRRRRRMGFGVRLGPRATDAIPALSGHYRHVL